MEICENRWAIFVRMIFIGNECSVNFYSHSEYFFIYWSIKAIYLYIYLYIIVLFRLQFSLYVSPPLLFYLIFLLSNSFLPICVLLVRSLFITSTTSLCVSLSLTHPFSLSPPPLTSLLLPVVITHNIPTPRYNRHTHFKVDEAVHFLQHLIRTSMQMGEVLIA